MSAIPQYVGTRFVSLCLGVDYKQAHDALRHAGLRPAPNKTYPWIDVEDALGRRFISYDVIEMAAAHIDAASASMSSFKVSADIYDALTAAWHTKGGVPHGVATSLPRREKKRKPAKGRSRSKKTENDEDGFDDAKLLAVRAKIAESQAVQAAITQERLAGTREQNEFRRLHHRRLEGMLCDRRSVIQKSDELGRIVQRFIQEIPGRVVGYIAEQISMSDEELRIIEQLLEGETLTFLRELRKDVAEIETEAVKVATAKRYGERNGSDVVINRDQQAP